MRFTPACLVAALALWGAAQAAPGQDRPAGDASAAQAPPGAGSQRPQERPEVARYRAQLRKHLQERRDRAKRLVNRVEELLERLEAGADPNEIRQKTDGLPDFARPATRPGAMGPGRPAERPTDKPAPVRPRPAGDAGEDLVGLETQPSRPLAPDERDAIVAILRDRNPQIAEHLESLKRRSSNLYDRTLDSLAPRVRLYRQALEHDDQDMADLRFDDLTHTLEIFRGTFAYVAAFRSGDADRITAAGDDLRAVLGRQFDTRVAIREREIAQLVRRAEAMSAELAGLKDRKQKIIGDWQERMRPSDDQAGPSRRPASPGPAPSRGGGN